MDAKNTTGLNLFGENPIFLLQIFRYRRETLCNFRDDADLVAVKLYQPSAGVAAVIF